MFGILRSIIVEQGNHDNLLFLTPENDVFYATSHQTFDRLGNKDYETIRDIILQSIDSNIETHERVGIPNNILSEIIEEKYPKIILSFKDSEPGERIKFVYKNNDNEDEEVFDYLEFIVERSRVKSKRYTIPTSTYSDTGNYLKFFNKFKPQQRKVMLENYFHIKTVIL